MRQKKDQIILRGYLKLITITGQEPAGHPDPQPMIDRSISASHFSSQSSREKRAEFDGVIRLI